VPSRRDFVKLAAALMASGCRRSASTPEAAGRVIGEPTAEKVGEEVIASGGNAIDGVVAAALVAGVVGVPGCGIGGYGGHMTIATAQGKVTSIDYNSMAPASFHERIFPVEKDGSAPGRVHLFGWLAVGVPGTLAGMQLALDRYGTRSFAESVAPAIRYARDGFEVSEGLAKAIAGAAEQFQADPASERLFFRNGRPLAAGEVYRNPDLASMLETLAREGSVESFYRGEIARRSAAEFRKHGGAVTEEDLAAYQAREVEPLVLKWRDYEIYTAPLTSGGATALEALRMIEAIGWREWDDPRRKEHALVECLRLAWHDRLTYFGDPAHVDVPLERLLSAEYAEECAARVKKAVEAGRPLELKTDYRAQEGTFHLSAVDRAGNMAAVTLTHGGGFGARVTVDGLGLLLGHGMSRFDPRPGKPNSPGSRKRPLHNMCPAIVLRDGKPVIAAGGRGGRRIPNAMFRVLLGYAGEDLSMEDAVAAARLHTEGGLELWLDAVWKPEQAEAFRKLGYDVRQGSVAVVTAVARDAATGRMSAALR
jgi:gamma-glutamyltranspeptidase/glutathione hydrolase